MLGMLCSYPEIEPLSLAAGKSGWQNRSLIRINGRRWQILVEARQYHAPTRNRSAKLLI